MDSKNIVIYENVNQRIIPREETRHKLFSGMSVTLESKIVSYNNQPIRVERRLDDGKLNTFVVGFIQKEYKNDETLLISEVIPIETAQQDLVRRFLNRSFNNSGSYSFLTK